MSLALRPLGGVMLGLESSEHVIGMIFDDVVSDRTSIDAAFRTSFNVDRGHLSLPWSFSFQRAALAARHAAQSSRGIGAAPDTVNNAA
jgi:hypothetical protein